MRIDDIIAGSKKRKQRNARSHRTVQKDLFNLDTTKLSENNGARIQHLEDLVLWDGSKGAMAAINKLRQIETQPNTITIKWDGKPAVIFGRNERGEFVFTDKSGFGAKGYDGRVTNGEALEQMLNSRGKEGDDSRKEFAAKMRSIWDKVESVVPANFRGYVLGDLLYFTTPPADNSGRLTFQPNTTEYAVDVNSEIGNKIQDSDVGVVVHKFIDLDGNIANVDVTRFQDGDTLIMPPATITKAPGVDLPIVDKLESYIQKNASAVDKMLNVPAELKMSDFANILYTFINNSVKTGNLDNLTFDTFTKWVSTSKLSNAKKERVVEYIKQHAQGFEATFTIVSNMMKVKNQIIAALDNQPADIQASTGGQRGGEGYVVDKDVKLVNRAGFTAANMAMNN